MFALESLSADNDLYKRTVSRMRTTIQDHDNGIPLKDYKITNVYKIVNPSVFGRFNLMLGEIERDLNGSSEIIEAFHGSPDATKIAREGFDVSFSKGSIMFGKGIYVAPQSSKANQYCFGRSRGCPTHRDIACKVCTRQMLICLCVMGRKYKPSQPTQNIPTGFHSVAADPNENTELARHLRYPEYCILNGDQILPVVLVKFTITDVGEGSGSSLSSAIQSMNVTREDIKTMWKISELFAMIAGKLSANNSCTIS
ncbi:poly [ADP-ribose] polymerase tankyrase-1-like [Neocloeon triangulifer]|uniref:poly [ADP-ribose] polymerase tankyrase-1-like n=1 Tax=Neocloeon triangulifer TaxID=2078957 RepID=UPI00286EF16F|nr:poly [ADP-ribose] polymerase tankyrase-1-like [Neocloeon triangulifer]